jgi:PIN domain nuclease of toxin-antitoxin system
MSTVVLDASAVLTWVLQERRWKTVDQILDARDVRTVLPAPAVTEVIYKARAKGNATAASDFIPVLTGVGIEIADLTHRDLYRAAELHELSQAHPGPRPVGSTLSLADSLILAVAERLRCPAISRDRYWHWLAGNGLVTVPVRTI